MKILLINGVFLAVAIVLFTRGFLLMRLEMEKQSPPCNEKDINNTCWQISGPKFMYKKLVIIIIDALRYDFAKYEKKAMELPFQNKMPIFQQIMEKDGCTKGRLYRFWADAPTTTMQRIKGLTTGSLPTFIDLSKNFASSEITEDNILDQFRASGKNITFMGDDTWMNLFPKRFNKAFPYPSFDVKDLHTVDNGIMKHLVPEIKANDWSLLIAHFLGVDHCGHRYGPYHPEMPLKLRQMNEVVKNVIETIEDDTLLLVMGDHGMTYTGDHGGETFNEVNAALFAYSPAGRFKECSGEMPPDPVVNQVDIVPTISFVLGTSVPFANLGIVIQDLIPYDLNAGKRQGIKNLNSIDSLFVNAMQVNTYIKAYQKVSGRFPQSKYKNLTNDFKRLKGKYEAHRKTEEFPRNLQNFLREARTMCRQVWARFDLVSMLAGLNVTLMLIIANFFYLTQPFFRDAIKITAVTIMILTWFSLSVSLVYETEMNVYFSSLITVCAFAVVIIICAYGLWKFLNSMSLIELIAPSLLAGMYSVSFTANSFILNEDITALYFSLSMLVCLALIILRNNFLLMKSDEPVKPRRNSKEHILEMNNTKLSSKPPNCRKKRVKSTHGTSTTEFVFSSNVYLILLCLSTLLCTRLALGYRYCRAEQFWCFHEGFENNTATEYLTAGTENVQLFLSSGCLIVCISLVIWTMKKNGNLRNMSVNFFLLKYSLPLCGIFIIISWILLVMPAKLLVILPESCVTLFPRVVYFLVAFFAVRLIINPVFSSVSFPDGNGGYSSYPKGKLLSDTDVVHHMYKFMKNKLNKGKQLKSEVEDSSVLAINISILYRFIVSNFK